MTPQQPAAPSNNPKPEQSANTPGPGPGEGPVNMIGIIVIAVYTILLTVFSTYILIKIWPHCIAPPASRSSQVNASPDQTGGTPPNTTGQTGGGTTGGSTTNTTGQTGGGTTGGSTTGTTGQTGGGTTGGATTNTNGQTETKLEPECKSSGPIQFFWSNREYWLWEEIRLLLIVLIAGVLGGLLHVIRSLFWYVGQRDLRWSWVLMYVLLPFAGALLALAFYLIIRGGFFPMAKADESNPIGFAALAMLIGLFSAQAGVKLKVIFETVFSAPAPGANAQPQKPGESGPTGGGTAPKITALSPDTGSIDGGDSVTISGENFAAGATVQFGGALATSVNVVNGTTITATTPAHEAAKVEVVVTNPDGQSATLPDKYTYL